MSAKENIALIQAFMADHDAKFMAEEATFHDYTMPEVLHGREAASRMLDMLYRTAFPGSQVETRHITADDDQVVVEFTFRGVNDGNLMGLPATHKPVEIPMCAVYEVANGKIQATRLYYDSSLLTRQLGLAQATSAPQAS